MASVGIVRGARSGTRAMPPFFGSTQSMLTASYIALVITISMANLLIGFGAAMYLDMGPRRTSRFSEVSTMALDRLLLLLPWRRPRGAEPSDSEAMPIESAMNESESLPEISLNLEQFQGELDAIRSESAPTIPSPAEIKLPENVADAIAAAWTDVDEPVPTSDETDRTGPLNWIRAALTETASTSASPATNHNFAMCLLDHCEQSDHFDPNSLKDEISTIIREVAGDVVIFCGDALTYYVHLPNSELEIAKEVVDEVRQVIGQTPFRTKEAAPLFVTASCALVNTTSDENADSILAQLESTISQAIDVGGDRVILATPLGTEASQPTIA